MLHGFGNWVQSYLVLSSGSYVAQVAYGVLPWAIALVLLKRYGPELGARAAQDARRVTHASSPAQPA